MKRKTILVIACLALLGMVYLAAVSRETAPLFHVNIATAQGQMRVNCWESDRGAWVVFLPSFSRQHSATIVMDTQKAVSIDGKSLYTGMECSVFPLNEPLEVRCSHGTAQITFVQSNQVGTMWLYTQSGSMEYIHDRKGNKETGTFTVVSPDGAQNHSGKVESFRGRGNYSWAFCEKKTYGLTLAEEGDLLGMGAAKEWILLANATDATHLRNKIVFDFAEAVGLSYSPDAQWVDLYLNGEYAGLYLLSERNEVHENRVNLAPQESWLVSLELEERIANQGIPYVNTDAGLTLRIHAPETLTDKDKATLQRVFQSMERAVLSEDGIDPVTGKSYLDLIDLDSWAKKYLIEEIFGNLDGCFLSQYFYCENGGKVCAGPVWDYDLSMGNVSRTIWQLSNPHGMFAGREQVKETLATPWFAALWNKEEFRNYALRLYAEEYKPLLTALLEEGLADYAQGVAEAVQADGMRWPSEYQGREIRSYLTERLCFLEALWSGETQYCWIRLDDGANGNYAYYAVPYGTQLEALPNLEEVGIGTPLGWFYAGTQEAFDPETPITSDIQLEARWPEKGKPWYANAKTLSLAVISVLGCGLLLEEIRRNKRNG